ncbi:MAG: hypothetical protein KME47_09790 [Nodosilinea sp. WJT8-NPBG4]|nr:hypothetical protein [Nodosilinea sp. WJT8-NPBG4]
MNSTMNDLANKQWPAIFQNTSLIQSLPERELCAQIFCAWALCSIRPEVHNNFGHVMAACATRLCVSVTDESLTQYCKDKGWLS